MIIFIDGSSSYKGNIAKLGWGIVAHHENNTIESFGGGEYSNEFNNSSEIFSFIEGYLVAKSKNIEYSSIVFYTDCSTIVDASLWVHPHNYGFSDSYDRLLRKIERICKRFYKDHTTLPQELDMCFKHSRFHKVKGHSFTVDNNRADYLASKGRKNTVPMKYDDWLKSGFQMYSSTGPFTWFPPFCKD